MVIIDEAMPRSFPANLSKYCTVYDNRDDLTGIGGGWIARSHVMDPVGDVLRISTSFVHTIPAGFPDEAMAPAGAPVPSHWVKAIRATSTGRKPLP